MTAMQNYAQSLLNPQDPQAQQPQQSPTGQQPPQLPQPQGQPASGSMQMPAAPQMPSLPQVAPPQVQPVSDDAGRMQQVLADPNQYPTGPHGERLDLNRRTQGMEYIRQGEENAERLNSAASGLQIKAEHDRMRAEQQQAAAIAPLQQDMLQKQQQAAQYTAMLDQKVVSIKQQAAADYQHRSEYYMQKAAENPADVWGNWNNAQRVTGVVGMVAAGLSHQSATGYIQNFADQAVAQQRREIDLMGHAFGERDNMYNTYLQAYGDQKTATNAMYATYYQLAGEQMRQVAAQYANPIAQANLNKTAAELTAKSADHQQKMIQNVGENMWKNINAGLEEQKLANERDANALKRKELDGIAGEDLELPIPKEVALKVGEKTSAARNVVQTLEEIKAIARNAGPENYNRFQALSARMFEDLRGMGGDGAKIEQSEEAKIFKPQMLTPTDWAKDKLNIARLDDKINAIQENSARVAMDAAAPFTRGNTFRPESPLYEPYERLKKRDRSNKEEAQALLERKNGMDRLNRQQELNDRNSAAMPTERPQPTLSNAAIPGMGL